MGVEHDVKRNTFYYLTRPHESFIRDMGHGDEIVLADGNFPSASHARQLIRCDGHGIPKLLEAILKFLPLDTYVEKPVTFMGVVPGDPIKPTIWNDYEKIILAKHGPMSFHYVQRFEFYEQAKKAYAIVATGEGVLNMQI